MADFKVIARSNGKLSESALGTGDHLLVSGADGIKVKDGGTIGSASAANAITIDNSGNVTFAANLTVSGTTTTVDSTTVSVADPIFEIGASGVDDNLDRGIKMKYNSSGAKVAFMGYDDSSGKFLMIPDATDTSSVFSGTAGTLVANLEGNVTGNVTGNTSGSSGSCTGNAATATALANGRTFLVDLAETNASAAFDGTGNISDIGVTGVLANANVAQDLTIVAGTVNNSVIGGVTPAAGSFTTLSASTTVTVGTNIIHDGDANNLIGFGTDTQSFETGGTARMNISDSGFQLEGGARVTSIDNGALGSSATLLATQGAIKTYVDAQVGGAMSSFTVAGDGGSNQTIDDSDTLNINGTTNQVSTAMTEDTVTISIDNTVNFTVGSDQSLGYVAGSGTDATGHSINIKGQTSTGTSEGGEVRLWSCGAGDTSGTDANSEVKIFAATGEGAKFYDNVMHDTGVNTSSGTIAFGELVAADLTKGTSASVAIIGMHGSFNSATASGASNSIKLLTNGTVVTGIDTSSFAVGNQLFLKSDGTLQSGVSGIGNNLYQVGFVMSVDANAGKIYLDVKHVMSL